MSSAAGHRESISGSTEEHSGAATSQSVGRRAGSPGRQWSGIPVNTGSGHWYCSSVTPPPVLRAPEDHAADTDAVADLAANRLGEAFYAPQYEDPGTRRLVYRDVWIDAFVPPDEHSTLKVAAVHFTSGPAPRGRA